VAEYVMIIIWCWGD